MKRKNTNMTYLINGLSDKIAQRPVVFPAILLVLGTYLCVAFQSLIPIFVIDGVLLLMLFLKSFSKARYSVAISLVLLNIVLIVFGNSFEKTTLHDVDIDDSFVVESISQKLDGSSTIILSNRKYGKAVWYLQEEDYFDICLSDLIKINGSLNVPDKTSNPGQFDFRDYLNKQGIRYVLKVKNYNLIERSNIGENITTFQHVFFDIKQRIYRVFPDENELCASVFLGDSSLLEDSIRSSFQKAGCSHILAVSGTHFSGFLSCLPFIFERLNIRNKKSLLLYAVFCILLGSLTGWSSSVTRASIMSLASFSSRDSISGLSLASIIILISNPYSITSMGFLMSFACGISIKLYSRRVSELLSKFVSNLKFRDALAVMFSSQIGIIPFWTTTGYYISPYNFIIQMIASSLAEIACTIFVPLILLALLTFNWISVPLVLINKIMLSLVKTSDYFHGIRVGVGNSGKLFCFVLMTFLIYVLSNSGIFRRCIKVVFIFSLAALVGIAIFENIYGVKTKIVFIDVGQGDSCLVMSEGKSVLIDGGVYKEGEDTIPKVLDYYSIDKIDIAVMTHWDQDHAGGIAALYNAGRIEKLCTSYVELNDDVNDFISSYFYGVDNPNEFLKNIEVIRLGDRINVSDTCVLKCLWPQITFDGGNEDSVVFLLESNNFKCLLTGDIGTESELRIVENELAPDCDMLKVSHHGSKYSSSREFLGCINPEYAVISVSKYNNYGHPHSETINSLDEYDVHIYETSKCGAVIVSVFSDYWKIDTYI